MIPLIHVIVQSFLLQLGLVLKQEYFFLLGLVNCQPHITFRVKSCDYLGILSNQSTKFNNLGFYKIVREYKKIFNLTALAD